MMREAETDPRVPDGGPRSRCRAGRKGRVTLLGDAAHPMYPRGSNGAGQAILDARALTGCLRRSTKVEDALKEYERRAPQGDRRPRADEPQPTRPTPSCARSGSAAATSPSRASRTSSAPRRWRRCRKLQARRRLRARGAGPPCVAGVMPRWRWSCSLPPGSRVATGRPWGSQRDLLRLRRPRQHPPPAAAWRPCTACTTSGGRISRPRDAASIRRQCCASTTAPTGACGCCPRSTSRGAWARATRCPPATRRALGGGPRGRHRRRLPARGLRHGVTGRHYNFPMAELTRLGRYQLKQVLGRGAMGVVYEGLDPSLNRRVAVKTILKNAAIDAETAREYSAQFAREAQAAGAAEPSEHRAGARLRRGRRCRLPGHGIHPGPRIAQLLRREGEVRRRRRRCASWASCSMRSNSRTRRASSTATSNRRT